ASGAIMAPPQLTASEPDKLPVEEAGLPAQPANPTRRAFHAAQPDAIARYWRSSLDEGLSADEVASRLRKLGPNRLAEAEPPSLLARLFGQISDSTVLALLGAAAI